MGYVEPGGLGSAHTRSRGKRVICGDCSSEYLSSTRLENGAMCPACRLLMRDTDTIEKVPLEDVVTVGVLAESYGVDAPKLLGLARVVWKGLGLNQPLSPGQERRLSDAAAEMSCGY